MLPPEQISIEDRIEQLLARLSETEACGFEELFADVQTRAGMIVTFLALLEMIRLKLVRVFQQANFGADPGLQARTPKARRFGAHVSKPRVSEPKPTPSSKPLTHV